MARPNDNDWTRAIHHQLNIKRRTCSTYIPTPDEGKDSKNSREIKCGCKRLRREHSWDVFENPTGKWNSKEHTIPACNNAYGFITHNQQQSFYIRCDMETPPETLLRLMLDVWKMKEPNLIMCIIGGAKYFKMNERLEREFMKGIIQAALKAGKTSSNNSSLNVKSRFQMVGLLQQVSKQVSQNLLEMLFMIIK